MLRRGSVVRGGSMLQGGIVMRGGSMLRWGGMMRNGWGCGIGHGDTDCMKWGGATFVWREEGVLQ